MHIEVNTIDIGNYNIGILKRQSSKNQCDSQCYL